MRNGYRQSRCLLWVGGTSPVPRLSSLWSCDPRGDPSPGRWGDTGQGCYSVAFQAWFLPVVTVGLAMAVFGEGGLILRGPLQGFVAPTLMLRVV